MEAEDIEKLFPLKGVITQEIIDKADLFDPEKCIGARTLRDALPEEALNDGISVVWADVVGMVRKIGKFGVIVTTEGDKMIDMTKVTEPMEVVFILYNNQ